MRLAQLRAGELEVAVTGGELLSVTSLRHRGEELLVGPEALPAEACVHGRRAGITLLHPWANRLPDVPDAPGIGRDPNGLALHGLALPDTWRIEPHGPLWAVATARFAAHPAFPHAHTVQVTLELDERRLTVTTELRGDDVPVAFGWHPYFRVPGVPRAQWRLDLPARRHLTLDDRGLPTGAARDEEPEAAPLGDRTFDDAYAGLEPGAVLGVAGGGRELRVTHTEGYPCAQVYAPGNAAVVSLEPMTAPTAALTDPGSLARAPYRAVFTVEP